MTRLLGILHKLKPTNSLFGKIFIWFWLSVSLLLIVAFLLARLSRLPVDVSQPNAEQLAKAERISESVQNALDRGLSPERALRRAANRGRWQLMIVDIPRKDLILGFPAPMLPSKQPILELAESSQTLMVTTPSIEFIGPFTVPSGTYEYKLFVGRLLRRDERPPASWGISLVVVLTLGSLLCLLLAWRLSKPLGELGAVSRAFADGDLTARVPNQSTRQDEIGQLAADFNLMADKLNASMLQQHLLMANVSHELRTPLTRLQLSVAMLQDKYSDDEYLSRIEHEIIIMDKLIGQILRLTRMQNASNGLFLAEGPQFEEITFDELFSDTLESLQFEAQAMGKHLTSSALPSVQLRADPAALISAFENITRNAIKFSKSEIWIQISVSKEQIIVHVDDNGGGLPDEQLGKLFEPFYQSQHTSNITLKGVGLGLAIAKAAVNLHDGNLLVTHSQHGGLRFTISLPR
ncbi:ATP-binding protein [Glaciecola sp. SC05]|uniref:ATP-binding protein n=1 Tax=Glaciecola sp. SC05 TaxID=1987355 RepID=UPI003527D842